MKWDYVTVKLGPLKASGLTFVEAGILDLIYHLQANQRNAVSGWCENGNEEIAQVIGVSRQTIITALNRAESIGLIERAKSGLKRTSQLYYDHFVLPFQEAQNQTKCKETLQRVKRASGVKKLDTTCKETLQEGVKKLDTTPIYSNRENKEEIKESESAGENQVVTDETLQTEEEKKETPGGAATMEIVEPTLTHDLPAPVRPDPFYRNRNAELLNVPFSVWFAAYEYKAKESFTKPVWVDLTNEERLRAMAHTPDYVAAHPDKRYRQLPDNYLLSKTFNDEIVSRHAINPAATSPNRANGHNYPAGQTNNQQPTRRKGYLAPGALSRDRQSERNPAESGISGTIRVDVE